MVQHDDLIKHGLIQDHEICEKVLTAKKYRTIHAMFIVEQALGLETLETVLVLKKDDLTLIFRHSDEPEPILKNYGFRVKSISAVNSNNFIIQEEGTNNVRLLTVNYSGTSFY